MEERLGLVHGFKGFSPSSLGSVALRPEVRQNIMVEVGDREQLISWQPERREREEERKGPGPDTIPRVMRDTVVLNHNGRVR